MQADKSFDLGAIRSAFLAMREDDEERFVGVTFFKIFVHRILDSKTLLVGLINILCTHAVCGNRSEDLKEGFIDTIHLRPSQLIQQSFDVRNDGEGTDNLQIIVHNAQ